MKAITYLLIPLFLFLCSCQKQEELSATELQQKIEKLRVEINEMILLSTGESSADCRTSYINGGNGCGPIYVYGVVGIDTLALDQIFQELSDTQTALFELEGGTVCDLIFPSKDSLINGSCKACYGEGDNFDCF